MNNVRNITFMLSSLSVFRGVLAQNAPKSFYRLLCSLNSEPEAFLGAWGEFFSVMCEQSNNKSLSDILWDALLFDDNCFTRAAAAKKEHELPENILNAAERDLNALLLASALTKEAVLSEYKFKNQIDGIAASLPEWNTKATENNGKTLETVAEFCRLNGCGIFARYNAFIWRDEKIEPVIHSDSIAMDNFTGYERQRNRVDANTRAFINGKSCSNCLLYGDMGTGKSSTVKAVANKYRSEGLRIVEIPKERLMDFPKLVDKIALLPMRFIIFIDDLSFQNQDESYTALKAVLEGGVASRPDNALIYATSNRRHLVKERLSDRAAEVDDIHTRDNMQETLSLSDRFGLRVCYSVPTKNDFLEIVFALANENGIDLPKEKLAAGAERFALAAGGRSPRCAKQYVESLYR